MGNCSTSFPLPDTSPPIIEEYCRDRFRTAARLGIQAARALADAHRQGFLHRDIKPSNLMVDHHGHVYLLDFGLTRARDPGGLGTRPGTVLGTPLFMSPEQARGERVDQRSDLYSLGLTLYQLVTLGSGPFRGDPNDSERVLEQARLGAQTPLRQLAPEVPPELEQIIMRAVHIRPGHRYPDASQLAADLEAFVTQTPAVTAPRPARRLRRPIIVALTILLAFSLALAAFLLFPRGRPEEQEEIPLYASPGLPYPDFLRHRQEHVSLPLLRDGDFQPVWYRRLWGTGTLNPSPLQLWLISRDDETLIALDDDPQRRWFEFSVELSGPRIRGKDLGVFIGWRPPRDPRDISCFYKVEVNRYSEPGFPNGFWSVQAVAWRDSAEPALGRVRNSNCLARQPFQQPLAPADKYDPKEKFKKVVVRASKGQLTVMVDHMKVTLDKEQLERLGPRGVTVPLDLRGALGIWAENNEIAFFRNAFIKALP